MRMSSVQEAEGTTEAHRCRPLQAGGLGWQKRRGPFGSIERDAAGSLSQIQISNYWSTSLHWNVRVAMLGAEQVGTFPGVLSPTHLTPLKAGPTPGTAGRSQGLGSSLLYAGGGSNEITVSSLTHSLSPSAPSSCVPACLMLGLREKPANKQIMSAQLFICDYLKYMVLESRGKTGKDVSKFSINNSNELHQKLLRN